MISDDGGVDMSYNGATSHGVVVEQHGTLRPLATPCVKEKGASSLPRASWKQAKRGSGDGRQYNTSTGDGGSSTHTCEASSSAVPAERIFLGLRFPLRRPFLTTPARVAKLEQNRGSAFGLCVHRIRLVVHEIEL